MVVTLLYAVVDGGDMVGSITGDRFQHWLSQYEAERNSLKSQVRSYFTSAYTLHCMYYGRFAILRVG